MRQGMLGALPPPAWGAVARMLSSPEDRPERAWRAAVLELRRTCRALAELVGAGCVGGAGWLKMGMELKAAPTQGLGRALVVFLCLSREPGLEQQEALALAVERGHMVRFEASWHRCPPAAARVLEAALIDASREGLLLDAYFDKAEASGWSIGGMSQLSAVELSGAEQELVEMLVGGGALQRAWLWYAEWADVSILSSLREVKLSCCDVVDLSPLADVPTLIVDECNDIQALPAMRNDVLEVKSCESLTDVSGLAHGRVGRVELRFLSRVEDVSAIGAMQPLPRTVILRGVRNVQDVSMLAGIRRLELINCRKLNKAATLAALEGKVGAIQWLAVV